MCVNFAWSGFDLVYTVLAIQARSSGSHRSCILIVPVKCLIQMFFLFEVFIKVTLILCMYRYLLRRICKLFRVKCKQSCHTEPCTVHWVCLQGIRTMLTYREGRVENGSHILHCHLIQDSNYMLDHHCVEPYQLLIAVYLRMYMHIASKIKINCLSATY